MISLAVLLAVDPPPPYQWYETDLDAHPNLSILDRARFLECIDLMAPCFGKTIEELREDLASVEDMVAALNGLPDTQRVAIVDTVFRAPRRP